MEIRVTTSDTVAALTVARDAITRLIGEYPAPAYATLEEDVEVAEQHVGMPRVDAKTGALLDTADAPRDTKGVAFSVDFCSQASEPFFSSGKRAGQWKKRRGVEDADYDVWYAGELAKVAASSMAAPSEAVNAAAAFGGGSKAPSPPAAPAPIMPTDCGGFMVWVSEKQAAQLITQADVEAAYVSGNVKMVDLFPPNSPATVAQRVETLYRLLAVKAGA